MRLIAYIRVSTDRQELGPEAQLEELHRWASVAGHEIVDVARDIGVSGATPFAKRPALNRAIACIPERCDGICVTKRDRLARDVLEAIMIDRVVEKLGGRVMLANSCGRHIDVGRRIASLPGVATGAVILDGFAPSGKGHHADHH